MATILYNSEKIRSKIAGILRSSKRHERRVVIVAYLGDDAGAYLPNPKGLHIICNPSPMATSPDAIRKLNGRGAQIQFSDKLHMKVYWTENKGCVITSANASSNAMGCGNLKEVGTYFKSDEVDIDKLIHYAKPYDITPENMNKLIKAHDRIKAIYQANKLNQSGFKRKSTPNFMAWYKQEYRKKWKTVWWDEYCDPAQNAKDESNEIYGRSPSDWINVLKDSIEQHEWLLTIKIKENTKKIIGMDWMWVDFVVPVKRDDSSYEKKYPCQAIQVHDLSLYSEPPFEVKSQRFKKAFQKAVNDYVINKFDEMDSLLPPKKILDIIAKYYEDR